MTKNEFKNIIEEVKVLIECNKVMIDMINNHDLDVSKIREVLSANISWLEFNLDCLQAGARKVF